MRIVIMTVLALMAMGCSATGGSRTWGLRIVGNEIIGWTDTVTPGEATFLETFDPEGLAALRRLFEKTEPVEGNDDG